MIATEDFDIGTTSNCAPFVVHQGGNGYDTSLEVSDTMVQGSGSGINSSVDNETLDLLVTSFYQTLTKKAGFVVDDKGSSSTVEPPRVGMIFSSWEEIDKYYRQYGMQQGFGVIKPASGYKGNNKNEKRNTTWKCECWGKPDVRWRQSGNGVRRKEDGESHRAIMFGKPRKSKKCGCTAMIYASTQPDGYWALRKVVLEHKNHNLTPNKPRNIKLPPRVMRRMFADMLVGLNAPQKSNILVNDSDVVEQTLITERHIGNAQEGRLKLKEGGAIAMLKHIIRMHQNSINFSHFMRHDCNGCLKDVLWVDGRSKAAYEEFGDVICFDTSYLTNGYDLPLVNFVGVNHHGQTILLGCALVSHEDTETFEWVFKMWLLCMDGIAPRGILTDQLSTIRKALAAVMPKTTHRWCIGHIIRKFPSKLGLMARYQEFSKELKNAICHSYTEEEFERRWNSVMNDYQLQGNEWLQWLFEERHMWVPSLINHTFWAGMSSVERALSVNGIFDGIVGKQTRLCEFLESYCFAMEARVRTEKDADDDCARYVRGVATHFSVESLFQKIYTDAKFREVQVECQRVLYCNSRAEKFVSETEFEYVMQDRVWIEVPGRRQNIPSDEKRTYKVRFNTLTNEVSCECKLFECNGIMCRHSIRLYDLHSVSIVPEKYILRRWRKDIPRKHTKVKVAYFNPFRIQDVKRYDVMQEAFEAVCCKAMEHDEALDIVMHLIAEMKLRVTECLEKHCVGSMAERDNGPEPMVNISSAGNEGGDENMNENQEAVIQNGDGFGHDLNINGWSCSGNN